VSLRTKVSVAGKQNFQGRDKEAETASKVQGRVCRDKISLHNTANSALVAENREAERTRTPCQAGSSIEPVSVTAPMLRARAHRAVAKVGPYAANPNQHRCRCTVRLDPAIKRRRTAQRHCREMTGNALRLERYCRPFPGAKGAPRSCPAGWIAVAGLRWCGAAANRTEDLNVQICKEANEQEGPEAA
jgi:hypothetical protein